MENIVFLSNSLLLVTLGIYFFYFARFGVLHPISIFLALIIIQFPLKSLYFCYIGQDPILVYKFESLASSAYVLLFFFMILPLGYIYAMRRNMPRVVYGAQPKFSMLSLSFALLVILFSMSVYAYGVQVFFSPLNLRSSFESSGAAYISQIFTISVWLALIFLNGTTKLRLLTFFLVFCLVAMTIGRPSWVLTYFLIILIYNASVLHKTNLVLLLFGIVFVPILAIFALIYRREVDARGFGIDAISESFNSMFSDGAMQYIHLIFTRGDQLELFSNLVDRIQSDDVKINPSFPFEVFVQFIPRVFWPEKPLNFSSFMTNYFNPEVFSIGATNNYLGVGEAYYSFGLIGVAVASLFSGILFRFLHVYYMECYRRPDVFVIMFAVFFQYTLQAFMSGYINDWALPMVLINLLFIYCTCKINIYKLTR